MKNEQLVFSLSGDEHSSFDNFYLAEGMQLLVETLKHNIKSKDAEFMVLSGMSATGKTHLMKASCLFAHEQQQTSLYLPLKELKTYDPDVLLPQLDNYWWLCIDDIDVVKGDRDWQRMLFQLYNHRKEQQKAMVFSMQKPVHFVDFTLADLKSRLAACLSIQLTRLTDDGKLELLQLCALKRGIRLTEACAKFIIQRSGRDLNALMHVIDRLDAASLKAGRKITIPFIKSLLQW